jgi:ribosomal protein S18 acetylase RimI-like enzyme
MIIRLDARRLDAASLLLQAAFEPDPMWAAVFPDPALRARALAPIYHLVVRFGHRYGEIFTDDTEDSVAVWLPSARAASTLWKDLRCGGLGVLSTLGPATALRLMRLTDHFAATRRRLVPVPHRYLWALAVRPGHQGEGRGSRLLEAGLEESDRERIPTYLETFRTRNVRLYERHGFEVRQTGPAPGYPVQGWSMVRPTPP